MAFHLRNGTQGCVSQEFFKSFSNYTNDLDKVIKPSCSSEYIFEVENGESSIVTEWNLVCEKEYLSLLGNVIYILGNLMGAWIAGIVADKIGRLPVLAICLYTQGTMAVCLYVVQDYPVFLVVRGLQGVFVQGLEISTYILALELFSSKFRTIVGLIMQIAWAVGLSLLAGLSYFIPDWRILQLAISVPTAATVLYIWIIPESPRWLLAKGKSTEADIALEKIVNYNGCCTRWKKIRKHDIVLSENETPTKQEKTSTLSHDRVKSATVNETITETKNLLENPPEVNSECQKEEKEEVGEMNCENIQLELNDTLEISPRENEKKNNVEEKEKEDVESEKSLNLKKERHSIRRISRRENDNYSQNETPVDDKRKVQKQGTIISLEENKTIKHQLLNEKKINSNFLDLLKYKSTLRHCAVLIQIWLSSSAAYQCVEFLLPNLNSNRHITFVIEGALEIASCIFIYFALTKYGRKCSLSICNVFIGLICIGYASLDYYLPQSSIFFIGPVKRIFLLLAKMIIASSFFTLNLCTAELFPTILRASCFGFCIIFGKFGRILLSYFLEIEKNYIPTFGPLSVVGMLSIGSGIVALTLPETLNRILPDTMEEANNLGKKFKIKRQSLRCTRSEESQEQILREKLFSENWVDAGNGIIVNFNEGKNSGP
ncbi:organic cation transporter protein-like isoform X2 [Leptopilina heterotoma]|uniref:organic cation transporter protein-like isoform X2 n=1 Tax=Leptopilina heterotoma TaxID=63436 RepID=UPI001CA8CEA5|nr:organic cation transporter protein-like isoform X2 [Leptopilina heterotoma]